jgi:hypothetical protein
VKTYGVNPIPPYQSSQKNLNEIICIQIEKMEQRVGETSLSLQGLNQTMHQPVAVHCWTSTSSKVWHKTSTAITRRRARSLDFSRTIRLFLIRTLRKRGILEKSRACRGRRMIDVLLSYFRHLVTQSPVHLAGRNPTLCLQASFREPSHSTDHQFCDTSDHYGTCFIHCVHRDKGNPVALL